MYFNDLIRYLKKPFPIYVIQGYAVLEGYISYAYPVYLDDMEAVVNIDGKKIGLSIREIYTSPIEALEETRRRINERFSELLREVDAKIREEKEHHEKNNHDG